MERPLDGIVVLVVEDHEASREATTLLLQSLGARVLTAANGTAALHSLGAEIPHVVLCDLRMPEMDGFAFVQRVRRDPRLARLPVIALTARGDTRTFLRTWSASFDTHLTKPVAVDTLVDAVRRVIARPRPPEPGLTPESGAA
jgi:CheY-like chemotaxis protein